MTHQSKPIQPKIKKPQTIKYKGSFETMIINNNIVPQEQDALDIHEARSLHASSHATPSGASVVDESLKQCSVSRYVKSAGVTSRTAPNKHSKPHNSRPLTNVSRQGRLTADPTPFNILKTGIDYLTFTTNIMHYRSLDCWIKQWLGGHQLEETKGKFYKGKFLYEPHRTSLSYGHNVNNSCKVEVPGTALQHLTHEKVIEMLQSLEQFEAKVTRIDLFTDCHDPDCRIVEATIEHAANPRSTRLTTKVISSQKQGEALGSTIYLGTNLSSKYWRIYDKGVEQGGSPNVWQRIELQCGRKDNYAMGVVQQLLDASVHDQAQTIRNIVFQDIWERELPYWSKMKTRDVKVRTQRNTSDFETWAKWIASSVLPRLRMASQELDISLERLIKHLDHIDTDDIVSVPDKYRYFLEQFQDSLLDESLPSDTNTNSHENSPNRLKNLLGQSRKAASDFITKSDAHPTQPNQFSFLNNYSVEGESMHTRVADRSPDVSPPLLNGRLST